MNLLTIENLRVVFETSDGRAAAVDGVGFSIEKGETIGLVGESGCGKTVTGLSILRLIAAPAGRIESGRILFEGVDLLALPPEKFAGYRGGKIGMIFQDPFTALNPVLTIGAQMCETVQLHRGITGEAAQAASIALLEEAGIADARDRMGAYPFQLSGGQQQRVMIALALAGEPELLIADEPTTALDATIQSQILESIDRIQERRGMAVLLITHDLGVVARRAARCCVMYAGKIVETGRTKELMANPLHPYTKALINALPSRARRGKPLVGIGGNVPSPYDFPSGCRFHPRCPATIPACAAREPSLARTSNERFAACILTETKR